jgi:hypothetical protein
MLVGETKEEHAMKPNIHPELYPAIQSARQEGISHAVTRQRALGHPHRSAWVARRAQAVAFFERALRDASAKLSRHLNGPTSIDANVRPLADHPSLPK